MTASCYTTDRGKLLLVSTGNISNRELEQLLAANLTAIANGFITYDYVELNRTNIIFHR